MPKKKLAVGNYLVCRYLGDSGDVIAGKVLKVRAGKAHIKNLLTGHISIRALSIVEKRNVVVPRNKATAIRTVFEKKGDKKVARKMAVATAKKVKEDPDS